MSKSYKCIYFDIKVIRFFYLQLPHLTPYIRFCSCQLRAAALIQHKTENSAEFKEVHKVSSM